MKSIMTYKPIWQETKERYNIIKGMQITQDELFTCLGTVLDERLAQLNNHLRVNSFMILSLGILLVVHFGLLH